jgi:hypothetical protein
MGKRKSLNDRENKRPIDNLFVSKKQNTEDTSNKGDNITCKQTDKKSDLYVRKTYHITQDLVDAIAIYSSFERKDKSEIVREALRNYIPEKYIKMTKDIE